MIKRPYTREERRKGKFVIHKKFPVKLSFAKRLSKWIQFKFKPEPDTMQYILADKELKKYRFVTNITEARAFEHEEAVKAMSRIKVDDMTISMIRWTGKNWLLS
ncbi:MAG: hypothetical protein ACRCYO_13560 [Bacteroidia bacterium]